MGHPPITYANFFRWFKRLSRFSVLYTSPTTALLHTQLLSCPYASRASALLKPLPFPAAFLHRRTGRALEEHLGIQERLRNHILQWAWLSANFARKYPQKHSQRNGPTSFLAVWMPLARGTSILRILKIFHSPREAVPCASCFWTTCKAPR